MTQSEIETAAFQLVAPCLIQLLHRVPHMNYGPSNIVPTLFTRWGHPVAQLG